MPTLTTKQISEVEKNTTYQNFLRLGALAESKYWKDNAGVGLADATIAENWFKRRQYAERLLDTPEVSVDLRRWAAQSLGSLSELDVAGIDDTTEAEDIANAITEEQYRTMATTIFEHEADKMLF
jgi:hypothetical protein